MCDGGNSTPPWSSGGDRERFNQTRDSLYATEPQYHPKKLDCTTPPLQEEGETQQTKTRYVVLPQITALGDPQDWSYGKPMSQPQDTGYLPCVITGFASTIASRRFGWDEAITRSSPGVTNIEIIDQVGTEYQILALLSERGRSPLATVKDVRNCNPRNVNVVCDASTWSAAAFPTRDVVYDHVPVCTVHNVTSKSEGPVTARIWGMSQYLSQLVANHTTRRTKDFNLGQWQISMGNTDVPEGSWANQRICGTSADKRYDCTSQVRTGVSSVNVGTKGGVLTTISFANYIANGTVPHLTVSVHVELLKECDDICQAGMGEFLGVLAHYYYTNIRIPLISRNDVVEQILAAISIPYSMGIGDGPVLQQTVRPQLNMLYWIGYGLFAVVLMVSACFVLGKTAPPAPVTLGDWYIMGRRDAREDFHGPCTEFGCWLVEDLGVGLVNDIDHYGLHYPGRVKGQQKGPILGAAF